MKAFVIMPFDHNFDDVYASIQASVTTAVPGESITCQRLDEIRGAGRISDDLVEQLRRATICLADLTGNNPNVMWEVGYAIALGKPLLLITQDLRQIPFDIKDLRAIEYDRTSLTKTLRGPLAEAVRATLDKYEVPREATKLEAPRGNSQAIVVTGSMTGDRASCARRVEALLSSQLHRKANWLCGSFGVVDEQVVEYLVAHDENVTVVGYGAYDISAPMLSLVREHRIPFIDAQKEQVPKGIAAPSLRDLFFLGRADLVILFWNGESAGTREMIDWYSTQEKDHVVGYF